jgi:hypothetical protein
MSTAPNRHSNAFAWAVNYARCLAHKSQIEIARAARLTLEELVALEQGRQVLRLWQVLLLADALDLDRAGLCRCAVKATLAITAKKQAAAAGVTSGVPRQLSLRVAYS